MPILVLDPPPAGIEEMLQRRRQWGADRHDETWAGVLHVTPAPSHAHAVMSAQVARLLAAPAAAAGLTVTNEFNLGDSKDDFRVPDVGLHRPDAAEMWHPTAALAVEIVSPGDESWQKLDFYADHDVEELLIVDPAQRTVDWLVLSDGHYQPTEHSTLIECGPAELTRQIVWA